MSKYKNTYSYYKSIALESLSENEYYNLKEAGMLFAIYPEACGIYKEDVLNKRIDIIGQNGNDGAHYGDDKAQLGDNPDGVSWPHRFEQGHAEKIEALYDPPKDDMFVDTYVPEDPTSPSHYSIGDTGVEAIDIIKSVLTKEQYIGYLRGNIIKYQLRANKKNGTEDLNKSGIYSGWLVEALEQ